MATLRELKAQMVALEEPAAAARAAEFGDVLADIPVKVVDHGFAERRHHRTPAKQASVGIQ